MKQCQSTYKSLGDRLPFIVNPRSNFGIGRFPAIVAIVLVLIAVAGVVYFVQSQQGANPLSSFKVEKVQISSPSKNSTTSGFAYLAESASEQTQGFQGVTSFGDCNGVATNASECIGMMFVFQATQDACFWMHDTILALQQVWIAGNGTVTAIFQAQPENDSTVCHSAAYVLETSPEMQISVGDVVRQSQA